MTNKLIVIINSLKVPKIKKILLYKMRFIIPNYSCLQKPWLGGYRPQIHVPPVLSLICWTPPRTKFLGTPLPAPMFQHYIFLLKCKICNIHTFIMLRFLCLLLLLWYTLKYQRTVVKTMEGTQYIMQKHIFLHFICICKGWQSGYSTLSAWFPIDGCGMLYAGGIQTVFYKMLSAHTHTHTHTYFLYNRISKYNFVDFKLHFYLPSHLCAYLA